MSLPFDKNKWSRPPYVRASDFFESIRKGNKSLMSPMQNAVISWSPGWTKHWAKNEGLSWGSFLGYSFCEAKNNNSHFFTCIGIGSPAAAVLMEQLICAGCENFISLGTAGALSSDLEVGDVVIVTKALRDEGTSYHYLPAEDIFVEGSRELLTSIEKIFTSLNLPYKIGKAWTTDAPFRETREEILKYQQMGLAVVDMETSAIYSVAKHYDKKALSIFVISDLLYKPVWTPQFQNKKLRTQYTKVLEALLNL